jgi:PAS domain S-box-containing protein
LIGMAMSSPTKGILEVNDELCRILGYQRSELLQKNWAEITHPDDLASDVAQFNRVMAQPDRRLFNRQTVASQGRARY